MKFFRYCFLLFCALWSFSIISSAESAQIEPNQAYAKAYSLYLDGNIVASQKSYEENIEKFPDFAPLYDGLGALFEKNGDFDQAKLYYSYAIKKAPEKSIYLVHFENIKYRKTLSIIENASQNFHKAIQKAPDNKIISENSVNYFKKNYKKLNFITDFYSDKNDKNLKSGNNARFSGNFDTALRYYILSLEKSSKKYKPYNNIGLLYLDKADFDNAAFYFNKAISDNPNSVYMYNNLGVAYFRQKKYAEAKNAFNAAYKRYKDYSSVLNNLAVIDIRAELEKSKDSILKLEKNLQREEKNLALIRLLAKFYSLNQDFDKALAIYDFIDLKNDYNFVILSEIAHYSFENHNYDRSKELIKKTIKLNPTKKNYLLLARIYDQKKEPEQAIEAYEKALLKCGECFEVYYFYGKFLARLNKEKEARVFLEKYVESSQDDPNKLVVKRILEQKEKL